MGMEEEVGKSGSMDVETSESEAEKKTSPYTEKTNLEKTSPETASTEKTSPDEDQPTIPTEPTQPASPLALLPLPTRHQPVLLPITHTDTVEAWERNKLWAKVMGTLALFVRFIILVVACVYLGIDYHDHRDPEHADDTLMIRLSVRAGWFLGLELVVESLGLWVPCSRGCSFGLRITSIVLLSVLTGASLVFIGVLSKEISISKERVFWRAYQTDPWIRVLVLDVLNVVFIMVEMVAFSVLARSPRGCPLAHLHPPVAPPSQPSRIPHSRPHSPALNRPLYTTSPRHPPSPMSFPQPQQPPSYPYPPKSPNP